MDCDVLIIGAGPVGSSLAHKLNSFGLKVILADKKTAIGKYACSGLFSNRITKYFQLESDLIENTIEGAVFHSPACEFEIRKKNTQSLVIDRPAFDRFVLKRATDSGVDVMAGHAFMSCEAIEGGYRSQFSAGAGIASITSSLIVGADGAASTVRRHFGLKGSLRYVNGIISYSRKKDTSNLVELYYSQDTAPGFFAWKIPRGTRTEIGLATNASSNHLEYFRRFSARLGIVSGHWHAHPICFGRQECTKDRMLLVGDAAAQVKPFSGGGIIYGLICADIAAKAINQAFDKEDFTKKFLKENYENRWKEKLMPKIEIGLGIRNILDSLSDRELDTFFETVKEHKSMIETFGDMDFL